MDLLFFSCDFRLLPPFTQEPQTDTLIITSSIFSQHICNQYYILCNLLYPKYYNFNM